MTFVLAIVKSILAPQRNDFGFNKCELKLLNNVGYCGKKRILFFIFFYYLQRVERELQEKAHAQMMLNNDSTDQIRATEMLEDMVHLSLNNVAAAAAAASASTSGNNNSGGGNSSSSTNSASSTASTVSSATSASATPAPPPPAPPTTTGHYSIWARKFKL